MCWWSQWFGVVLGGSITRWLRDGVIWLFHLQMRILFPFLYANYFRTFLLIMRTRSFLLYCTYGVHTQCQCTLVTKTFPHDCSTGNISCSEQKRKESDEKNQNETTIRQRGDSVTVIDTIASKIKLSCCCQSTGPVVEPLPSLSSSSIPWTRHLSSVDASVVVVLVFVLIFFRRRLCRRCIFLGAVVYPPPASAGVSVPSDAAYIPCPLPAPPSFSLILRARLTIQTPPSSSSIP